MEIQNSWQMNQLRLYRYASDFRQYYYNHILAEIYKKVCTPTLDQDLTVQFTDNHFSNVNCLDYRALHQLLSRRFRSVSFVTDSFIDVLLAPDYFNYADSVATANLGKFITSSLEDLKVNPISRNPSKFFGLHILRPDIHRFGILIELYRRNLLQYCDIRIGFTRSLLGAPEYRRASNFDLACFDFGISHFELLDLIDSLPQGDRNDFDDNQNHQGAAHMTLDVAKNKLHSNFAIEIVVDSSCHDDIGPFHGEKILRPCILQQPFIMISTAHWYDSFHLVNYQTFNQYWDESWQSMTAEWLPDKIARIADTCQDIVQRYQPNEIYPLTIKETQHNYDMVVNNKLGWFTDEEFHDIFKKIRNG